MKQTKLAYFLRGLGAGIIFVTAIMAVSGSNSKQTVIKTQELSKEEIIAKAKEYGMEEGVGMKVDQLLDATATPEQSQQSAEEITKDSEAAKEPAKTKEPEKTKKFKVASGQTAGEVAEALQEQGLIDDAQKFHQYLKENKYATKIIATEHTITINGSYEIVAKQLCGYK